MSVLYEVKNNVAVITIDKPEALNVLDLEGLRELDCIISKAQDDDDVYVLIITGAGRAFVAGADIEQMRDLSPTGAKAFSETGSGVFSRIEALPKPVIAAVNGFALGGGCELALACDIRIASEKAKFGQPEAGLGISPGFGGTQRLPRIVGAAKAKELIFTGRIVTAQEALGIGLVNEVVAGDELLGRALEMAGKIASNSQIAVRQSKLAINKGAQCDLQTGIAYETQAFALCFSAKDQKEAMTAFVKKR